jgi:CubicO group peptidase (beta-lactamase class C family)
MKSMSSSPKTLAPQLRMCWVETTPEEIDMQALTITYRIAHRIALAILVVAICLAVATASATPAGALPAVSAHDSSTNQVTLASGLSDPAELEVFLDDLLTRQLAESHIPGASVAVVKDGHLFFAKGYGYANLEQHTPLVADQTLVRVGSVAKLFTWTAVMQLAEQGKLDLGADINTYLAAFKIPATYPAPITLAHLLTHTAGFEDRQRGITVSSADSLVPLGTYLAGAMPARIFAPGTVTAYSNYGATLAGYIVERASGEPFAQYVQQHIFAPLGMRHSTFAQQLPPDLAAHLAVSYDEYDNIYHPLPFEYFQIAPAGGLSATATDIAQFMIAQLQDGRLGDARILQAATAQDMHRQHFTNDPHVNGMAYGFVEMTLNGQRLLMHSGTTNDELFRNRLVLLPEHKVGLFVSYTSASGGPARDVLVQAFLDRYYPAVVSATPAPIADFAQRAGQFAGSYQSTRSTTTTIEKVGGLFGLVAAAQVTVSDEGYLTIAGLSREPTQWVEVAPLVFQQFNGQETVVFRADDQGRITYLFKGNLPIEGYRKLAWHENPRLHLGLLVGCVVLFLTTLVVWPIGWLVARRKTVPRPRLAVLARSLAWGISALNLLFLILFVVSISDLSQFPTLLTKGALVLALVAAGLTVGAVACTALVWRRRYWNVIARAHYTLLTLGALAFIWALNQWNLLGFRW